MAYRLIIPVIVIAANLTASRRAAALLARSIRLYPLDESLTRAINSILPGDGVPFTRHVYEALTAMRSIALSGSSANCEYGLPLVLELELELEPNLLWQELI